MDITFLGHSSFKIKTRTATLVTDPFDPKTTGLKYSGVEGDIITVSHDHADHNAVGKVNGVKRVVESPGEYEIMGVSIIGYQSFHDNEKGERRGKNTIYVIEADGLRIVHLGDLGHTLNQDLVNEIGDTDVLLTPVGGEYTIGPKEASQVVSEIDPYFILPMHYQAIGLNSEAFGKLAPVEAFLKESGLPSENLPKLTLKKEDIIEDQTAKVIILEKK